MFELRPDCARMYGVSSSSLSEVLLSAHKNLSWVLKRSLLAEIKMAHKKGLKLEMVLKKQESKKICKISIFKFFIES
jgi:hypothetical protein